MKRGPQCNRVESDDTLVFCRVDGGTLVHDSLSGDAGTKRFSSGPVSDGQTHVLRQPATDASLVNPTTLLDVRQTPHTTHELIRPSRYKMLVPVALAICVIALLLVGYFYFTRNRHAAIESIAVLPFENRSGNSDTDYLSDGLADSLIYRLSQLPNLKVSPTSSVMRYKGKDTAIANIAKELNVDAVMSGRLVQRGDDLSISVQLSDARTEKLIWAGQYDPRWPTFLRHSERLQTR